MTNGLPSSGGSRVIDDITRHREPDVISQDQDAQQVREAAAQWVVKLGGGLCAAEHDELQHWLAADVRHGEALRFAEQTWRALGLLGSRPVATPVRPRRFLGALGLLGRRTVAVMPGALSGHPQHRNWRRYLATAAVLLLFVSTSVQLGPALLVPLLADQATAKGEIRSLTLADGSLVQLDSDSAIALAFSASERRVRLLKGDAFFQVAPLGPGETRPFVVESAGGSSRALGTAFVTGLQGNGAWTGVLEHSVEVGLQQAPAAGAQRRVVQQGQSVRYDAREGVLPLPGLDLQRATSWRRGMLVFDDVSLQSVAERLNHYRPGHIVIADGELGRRHVSGMFRLDSLGAALDTLTSELKAKRLDLPGLTLLY